MSDDLVERLRRYFPPPTQPNVLISVTLVQEAADRIEALEALVDRAAPWVKGWQGHIHWEGHRTNCERCDWLDDWRARREQNQ